MSECWPVIRSGLEDDTEDDEADREAKDAGGFRVTPPRAGP